MFLQIMNTTEISFLIMMLVILVIFVSFLVKGLQSERAFLRGAVRVNKKDQPVLFWLVLLFQVVIIIFLLAVLVFFLFMK